MKSLPNNLFSFPIGLLVMLIANALLVPASAQPPTAAESSNAYRLGPGDVVEFKYFYNPELNDSMPIRPDGKVSLPLIGDILLAGKTVMEVKNEIEKDYAPTLNRPAVNIVVRTFASQRVYVGGEVNRPSALPLIGEMTAQTAILDAGGTKRSGSTSKVILIRKGESGDAIRQIVDLNAQDSKAAANLKLRPFDVIIVPETKIAKVDRWVDEYLRQLIPATLAGGFSYLFNPIQVHTP
jgi:polysaccharide export outer membrane protein